MNWERVAGQHISMGGGDSWLAHSDAIDSTAMVTDETGAMVWDQVFGPWGQIWQQTGGWRRYRFLMSAFQRS